MLFSIIVPAYNVEKYIEECLESIREQSFIDFECIVVNDGSVDDTKRIVEKYAAEDSRFRIINKANGGLVSARKAGCTAAQGSYVLNVDGDDFIARDWLETIAGCILTNGEPDVIALGYTTWFKDGKSVPMRNHFTDGLYLGDHLELIKRNFLAFPREKNLYGIVYSLCCKAVKRELLVIYQLAVLDDLSIGEDVAVTFPLFLNVNSVVICNYCGYYYRQSTLSLMHSEKARSVDEMHQLFRYLTHWTSEEDEMQLGLSCYFRCVYFARADHFARQNRSPFTEK